MKLITDVKYKNRPYHSFLLESEPQMRTINVYSSLRDTIRVPFPYLYFSVQIRELASNKFIYRDCYGDPAIGDESGSHFQVFCNPNPLRSLDDNFCLSPTDVGVTVCLPHSHDGVCFSSKEKLIDFLIGLWWNAQHTITYNPFDPIPFFRATLNDLPRATFKKACGYYHILDKYK